MTDLRAFISAAMQAPEAPWLYAGPAERVPEGGAAEFVVGDAVLAIFRHQGQLFGLDAMCAHQGGPIAQGPVSRGCVTCPWHGWQYELATGRQTIHNQKLLSTYEVKEQQGTLYVRPETRDGGRG